MQTLKVIFDLCFFRARAQDLTYSSGWLGFFAVALVALYAILLGSSPTQKAETFPIPTSIFVGAVMVVSTGIIVWIFLRLRLKNERFVQTATAVYGTTALLSLVSWPASEWNMQVKDDPSQIGPLLILGLLALWLLAVTARIFEDALDVDFMVGLLYALAAQILSTFVLALLLAVFKAGG